MQKALNGRAVCTYKVDLIFWNINGVRNKFAAVDVQNIIRSCDILVINETHFNVRCKVPHDFEIIGKSQPNFIKRPRGGVAVFCKMSCPIRLKLICDTLNDCVVFEVENSDIVVIAAYIPPNNSEYFKDELSWNIRIMLDHFPCRSML